MITRRPVLIGLMTVLMAIASTRVGAQPEPTEFLGMNCLDLYTVQPGANDWIGDTMATFSLLFEASAVEPCAVSWGIGLDTSTPGGWGRNAAGDPKIQTIPSWYDYLGKTCGDVEHQLLHLGAPPAEDDASAARSLYQSQRMKASIPYGAMPGTFLDPAPTIRASSLALLPSGFADAPTGWQGSTRPTLHGEIDLVTGVPLDRYTDLELPFGGAVFRLTRTRSAIRPEFTAHLAAHFHRQDGLWDWAGAGWMASENPLLVINSTLPRVVGDGPPTCYLVLDAHRSIPFQLLEDKGVYEAPPRFRARMEHNGQWDPNLHGTNDAGWASRPTEFTVYLYDDAVKYTFAPIWNTVADNVHYRPSFAESGTDDPQEAPETRSLNDRPFTTEGFIGANLTITDDRVPWDASNPVHNPGLGLPHIGICTEIADRYGHRAQMFYKTVDGHALPQFTPGSGECQLCYVDAQRLGQLSHIRLFRPDDSSEGEMLAWTLVYSHRRFARLGDWMPSLHAIGQDGIHESALNRRFPHGPSPEVTRFFDSMGEPVIDRVYVYEGDGNMEDADLIEADLDTSVLEDMLDFEAGDPHVLPGRVDPLERFNDFVFDIDPMKMLPTDWQFRVVSQHYEHDEAALLASLGPKKPAFPPLLIRSSVEYADPDDTTPVLFNDHVFVYTDGSNGFDRSGPVDTFNQSYRGDADSGCDAPLPWLALIYDSQSLQALRSAFAPLESNGGQPALEGVAVDADDLVTWSIDVNHPSYWEIVDFAKTRHDGFLPSSHNEFSDITNEFAPTPLSLTATHSDGTQYLKNEVDHLIHDGYSGGSFASTVHTAVLSDGDGGQKYYRIHRFRRHPVPLSSGNEISRTTDALAMYPSAFAHPFKLRSDRDLKTPGWVNGQGLPGDEWVASPDLSKPRWIVVVDEFNSIAALESSGSSDGVDYDGETYDIEAHKLGMVSRRVVEMNATGYTLRDRRWEYLGSGTLASGSGLGEEFIYLTADDYFDAQVLPDPPTDTEIPDDWRHLRDSLLLVEHRSIGWSAADGDANFDSVAAGLVMFYDYGLAGPLEGSSIDPLKAGIVTTAEGIQQGADPIPGQPSGTRIKLYRRQYFRDHADDPFTVTCTADFTTPHTQPLPAAPALTGAPMQGVSAVHSVTNYVATDPPDPSEPEEAFERVVESRIMIGAPRQLYPNSDWYYPAEAEFYDDSGSPTWSANALALDPTNPSNGADEHTSVILTYFVRDDRGRSVHTVMDALPDYTATSLNDGSFLIPAAPQGWNRLQPAGQQVDAVNAITSFVYHREYGLKDVYFPNGRRWAKQYVFYPKSHELNPHPYARMAREFIFNDLALVDPDGDVSGNGPFVSESVGEVNDFSLQEREAFPRGGAFRRNRVVFSDESGTPVPITLGFGRTTSPAFQVEALVELAADGTGRIREASLLEPSINGTMLAVGSKLINDLGEVYREVEIDGSVSRTTKNQIGQVLRTYAGTEDTNWSKDPLDDPNFNMYLTGRTEYGSGPHDAWLPTITREYRYNPEWYDNFYGEVPPDSDGYATKTKYDWRMRPAITTTFEKGDPVDANVLSTSVTYYDHADRPVLTSTYGATLAPIQFGAVDPTGFDIESGNPSAADLFISGTTPLSVTEHIYDPSGHVVEVRSYDVAWDGSGGQPPYQATFSYRGRGDANVFSQSPGQPFTRSILDGLGRVAVEITAEPQLDDGVPYELTRTEFSYDGDGNVIETRRLVRFDFDPSSANSLTADEPSPNAVRTTTVSWYNAKKQLVAQAELGTGQADGYVAGPQAFSRIDANGDAQHSEPPEYNPTTNAVTIPESYAGTFPPSAKVWLNQYDRASGRLIREFDPRGTVTEYQYSKAGRLARKIENAAAPLARDRRYTEYRYRFGRLVEMVVPRFGATASSNTADPGVPGSDVQWSDAETTRIRYQADVLDESYTHVSQNNQLVGQMWLRVDDNDLRFDVNGPMDLDGDLPGTPDLELRYFFDGRVAERTDARGLTMRYAYDALGRLETIVIGHYSNDVWMEGYPASMNQPVAGLSDGTPSGLSVEGRVGYVEYAYDARGQLESVTAKTSENASGVLSQVEIAYDVHGRPTAEWQAIADLVANQSNVAIAYDWTHVNTDLSMSEPGYSRLSAMRYPMVLESSSNFGFSGVDLEAGRVVSFDYGSPGSIDHKLSRIVGLESSIDLIDPSASGNTLVFPALERAHVTAFARSGDGRRMATERASGKIIQDFANPELWNTPPPALGYPGLDAFGATKDLKYASTDLIADPANNNDLKAVTLYRSLLSRDSAGNPEVTVVDQAPFAGQPRDNVRSSVSFYDDLGRLRANAVGQYVPPNGSFPPTNPSSLDLASIVRSDAWSLDAVGNWSGGSLGDFNGDNIVDDEDLALLSAFVELSGGEAACLGCEFDLADSMGNLGPDDIVDFGDYIALLGIAGPTSGGRTTTGNLDGYGTPWPRDASELSGPADVHDESVLQYQRVDLRNRLTDQLFWDTLNTGLIGDSNEPEPRQHNPTTLYDDAGNLVFDGRYYFLYDAWNRLVEVHAAEWQWVIPPGGTVPEPTLFYGDVLRRYRYDGFGRLIRTESPPTSGNLANGFYTEDFYYDGVRRIQERVTDPESSGVVDQLRREYIWGPGDEGFDELLVQHDGHEWATRNIGWWSLFDTAGNMIALCDLDANGVARVAAQWAYEPYGDIIAAEHIHDFPVQTLGHKGLFLDRLDNPTNAPASLGSGPAHRLVPFAHSIYHNRNRVYAPSLGRFLQQDPNQTAMALLEGSYHGSAMGAAALSYSLEELYGDGFSLYGYLGGNALVNSDPTGLSWRESYEGVILPVVDAVTGMIAGDLLEILQGYVLMAEIHAFVQGAAFDQEERLDWALDWSTSDNDNPFFSRDGGFSDTLLSSTSDQSNPAVSAPAQFNFASSFAGVGVKTKAGRLNPIRMRGVKGERQARTKNGAMHVRRAVKDKTADDGEQATRYYDGKGRGKPGKLAKDHYMEVKYGYHSLNTRVQRQIDFDRKAIQDGRVGGVRWEFILGPKNREPSRELLKYLDDSGIKYSITRSK